MGYATDLTDWQWEQIKVFFVGENRGKHLQEHEKRNLVNAVLYLVKAGCQWRMLPNDFPKWQTVASFFYRARRDGLWEKITDVMVRKTRANSGRKQTPTFCLIDSQSVKTVYASEDRGIDGGKKNEGS